MRALLVLALLTPEAAMAGPFERHGLLLPADAMHERHPVEHRLTLGPVRPSAAASQSMTMSIGPLEADVVGQGKDRHFAHYHLAGTTILGGSIGGSFSRHSARIELTWKNE